VLCVGFLCALGLGAAPAAVRADPALKDTVCSMGTIQFNKGPINWRIKGVTTLTGLPAEAKGTTVAVTLTYETKRAGTDVWVKLLEVRHFAAVGGDTLAVDAGFETLTAAPAAGDQYRVKVAGELRLRPGAPGQPKAVAGHESPAVVPVR